MVEPAGLVISAIFIKGGLVDELALKLNQEQTEALRRILEECLQALEPEIEKGLNDAGNGGRDGKIRLFPLWGLESAPEAGYIFDVVDNQPQPPKFSYRK